MDLHTQLSKNMEDIVALFESRMSDFERSLTQSQTTSKNTSSGSDISMLAADYAVFKDLMWKSLSMLRQQLQLLTAGFDRHEMLSRRKVLLFHGLPEDSDEQTESKVLAVVVEKMNLSDFDISNIDLSHRLGTKKDRPRPILVRFTNLKSKHLVWNAKTALKGSGITLSEFLTKTRQEIFVAARKHFGMKYCWSHEGSITIALPDKSRKKVASFAELHSLMAKYPLAPTAQDPKPSRSRRPGKNIVK